MFRLFIVDDEKNTRESIKKHVPWSELGISEVLTAKNGIEALELADKFPPDIMLCDIRMPKMDGIELAANIRKHYPDCKLIFLSGFADKEYLKSAIHLKALQYIEKPIDIEEIKNAVMEAVSLLREELSKKKEAVEVDDKLSQSTPLLRSEVTLALVSQSSINQDSTVYNSARLLHFPMEGYYTCAYVILEWSSSVSEDRKNAKRLSILQSLSNVSFMDPSRLLAGIRSENDDLVLILAHNTGETNFDINIALKNIFSKLNEISDYTYSICMGIGITVSKISDISKSYITAIDASNSGFYDGFGQIYRYSKPMEADYTPANDFYERFREALQRNLHSAETIVRGLTSSLYTLKNIKPDKIRDVYAGLLLDAMNVAERMMLLDPSAKTRMPGLLHELKSCKTLSRLTQSLITGIGTIFLPADESSASNRKIQEAIKFIHQNYRNMALTIKMIADYTGLNQNYLCTLFKKTTGITLNDYINETRIEYAKRLLKDCSIKMYEVAEQTGFSDPNYFATIFKKYEGSTPSQFRNSIPGNERIKERQV